MALTLKGWSKAQLSYQPTWTGSMVTHWIKGSQIVLINVNAFGKILGKELMAAQKIPGISKSCFTYLFSVHRLTYAALGF
jgi:hypothetical protein